jgi:C1A family cysteine protease
MKRIYNLKKQEVDNRDYQLKNVINLHSSVKLPKQVDLRSQCAPVFDQGELGSCTANAGVFARMFLSKETAVLSRLFQYYNERVIENDVDQDGGAQMRDIGKAMQQYGICTENDMPYDISKFKDMPTSEAYSNALLNKIATYYSVPDIDGIKQVVALKQQPVLIGISVYSSFESDKVAATGIVPIPKKSEKLLGGHAVAIVGYDDTKKRFIVRNSWGEGWGDKGYFYLPYSFFTKGYASDFWVLQL